MIKTTVITKLITTTQLLVRSNGKRIKETKTNKIKIKNLSFNRIILKKK